MKGKLIRTCDVNKYDLPYASCELRYLKNKYRIVVLENGDDLFVDFEIDIENDLSPNLVIKHFENECINRLTCYGDFSLSEVKENSGEEISFY
jgi:hypothetical protein